MAENDTSHSFQLRNNRYLLIKSIGGVEGEDLELEFHRTNRLPYEGGPYPLPPGLGTFPIELVSDHIHRLIPSNWRKYQGVFFPMNEREAFWISFSCRGLYAKAIKMSSGRVNVLTGSKWVDELQHPQDYLVVGHPEANQPWIDGNHVGPGLIRQFLATPKGSGKSVEGQLTGEEKYGGIQLLVYLAKEPCREYDAGRGLFYGFEEGEFDERQQNVFLAKIAEQAERYEEMVEYMQKVAVLKVELTVEERNLLSVAYKNVAGARRASWRVLDAVEKQQEPDSHRLASVRSYRRTVEKELANICNEIIALLDHHLIPFCNSVESKVFHHKLKGDYYRYLAEFASGHARSEAARNASDAYKTAVKLSLQLSTTHPIRLGLALNYSVFLFEIANDPDRARLIATGAFENAIEDLDTLTEEEYKDSTLIMQLLKDNLTIWEEKDNPPEGESQPQEVPAAEVQVAEVSESAVSAPPLVAMKPPSDVPPQLPVPPELVEVAGEEAEGEKEEDEVMDSSEELKQGRGEMKQYPLLKQTRVPQEMCLAAGGLMKQEIVPDPSGLDYWNQEKIGSVLWIHIVSAQGFYEVTGKRLKGPIPGSWTIDMQTAPIENPVDIPVPEVMAGIKSLGELDADEQENL